MGLPRFNPFTAPLTLDERARLACIRQFFGNTESNMANMLLAGAVMTGVVAATEAALAPLLCWDLALLVACLYGWRSDRTSRAEPLTADNAMVKYQRRVAIGLVVAFLYATSCFLLPDRPTYAEDIFLYVLNTTTISLAVFGYASTPAYYRALSYVCIFPLGLHYGHRFVVHNDPLYLLLLGLLLAWQFVTLRKAGKVTQSALDAIEFSQKLQDEIDEHKQTKAIMEHMALHDPLTGLGNRRYLDQMLLRTMANARRDKVKFGVLSLDLNDFKPVNDQYGHAVGDALLQAVAERLRSTLRTGDFCARLGGDEFFLVVGSVRTEADLMVVASKVRAVLSEPYPLGQARVQINTSVGWAGFPDDGENADALTKVADDRMYLDKRFAKQQWDAGEPS